MANLNEFNFRCKLAAFIAPALIAGDDESEDQVGVWQVGSTFLDSNLSVDFFDDLASFLEFVFCFEANTVVYVDDLKHKGQIIVSFLMREMGYKPALNPENNFLPNKNLDKKQFTLLCADNGEWYTLTVRGEYKKMLVQFRDAQKLLPFKFEEIRESFNLPDELKTKNINFEKHQIGSPASEVEKEEIWKRVNIIKLALCEFDKRRNLNITIGQCCMSDYKRRFSQGEKTGLFSSMFPNLYKIETPKRWKIRSAGEFIGRCYQSGWCYLNPRFQGQILEYGASVDCNSLYPYVMSSKSGFKYPTGKPLFWEGSEIPLQAMEGIYFIHLRAAFKLKDGHFPCIKTNTDILKNRYKWLESSAVYYNDMWHDDFIDKRGNKHRILTDLYLTKVDFGMFVEHYDIEELKIIGGCYFSANQCYEWLFDKYISPYYKLKKESKGAQRQIAKLFLVNLSGKFAASKTIGSRFPVLNSETGIIEYALSENVEERSNPGYIAVGAMITAYGRKVIVDIAHKNKDSFVYADTDSFHGLQEGTFKGINFGDALGEWKTENIWPRGFFYRQKSYVLDDPKGLKVICAGMNDELKEMFKHGIKQDLPPEAVRKLHRLNKEFYNSRPDINALSQGLKLHGNKGIRAVKGGAVYEYTDFEILF